MLCEGVGERGLLAGLGGRLPLTNEPLSFIVWTFVPRTLRQTAGSQAQGSV